MDILWQKPYAWISRDDYVASSWQIIEWKNIDWNRIGFGWTLWPKTTKQVLTNYRCNKIMGQQQATWNLVNIYWLCDSWEIYRLTSTDLTPEHTLTNWYDIRNAVNFDFNTRYLTTTDWFTYTIARILTTHTTNWDWSYMDEAFATDVLSNEKTPPIITTWAYLYIWNSRWVTRYDTSDVKTSVSFCESDVVWLTVQWTTFKLYTVEWSVYFWDWDTGTSYTSIIKLNRRVNKVIQKGSRDYISYEDGSLWFMDWYSPSVPLKKKESRRLNDNSDYFSKLDFSNNAETWDFSIQWEYFIASDDTPWIYKYDNLINWLPDSFQKVITTWSQWEIDEVFTTYFYERFSPKKFFSYQTWTDYAIDIFDDTMETAQTWYIITDIIRWVPNIENQIVKISLLTSYTSWDNYIKGYKRVNNWAWVEFITINNSTDTIDLKEITTEVDNFFDLQLKWELHNNLQSDTPPILHEFNLEFEKTN